MQRGNKSAEKIADYKGIKEIMGKINLLKKIAGYRGVKKRAGFTLIEVVVAMAILLIIVVSVLMLATVSASSLKDSEARDMAKNIATYTIEYLRSRNVTTDNNFIPTSDWFNETTNPSGQYPGLVDLWDSPVNSNGYADEGGDKYINVNPALPDENYSIRPRAFYYSLQGYVSLGDFGYLSPSDPSPEDANAKIDSDGRYHDKATCSIGNFHGNRYIMRFPFNSTINNGANPNPDAIKNFTALPNYNGLIYTTNENFVDPSKPEYDPHYTKTDKDKCMAYRGFRVLTQIVARKKSSSDPDHVQYYDVKVTVFWVIGNKEHSYSLATQITTYGGS